MIRILLSRKGREIRNGHHEELQVPELVQGNIREIKISCMKGPYADDLTIQQGLRLDGPGIFLELFFRFFLCFCMCEWVS